MTPSTTANAFPRKSFFMEMFTRDISLEDCILDLIDNSIDALIRTQAIDISARILSATEVKRPKLKHLPAIELTYSETRFTITDNCGGIPVALAESEVFSFGHSKGKFGGELGAYGIGLKRAIFKIGKKVQIRSQTTNDGFTASIDLIKWAQKDSTLEDWKIPLQTLLGVKNKAEAGTTIEISELRPEVSARLRDSTFGTILHRKIAQTYSLFVNRYVRLTLNGDAVEPDHIPIGEYRDTVRPAIEQVDINGTRVRIIASLAARSETKQAWSYERAGWYILCNGRVALRADKTDLTGWGAGLLPTFHSKYAGFVGLVYFHSKNPLDLPWTTTKQGINREATVYRRVINKMAATARPIISFLNDMYKGDLEAEAEERRIAAKVKQANLFDVVAREKSGFGVARKTKPRRPEVNVQYKAKTKDVDKIKRQLGKPRWGASRIGKYTFEHFLENECPE